MFGLLIRHLAKAASVSVAGSCQYQGVWRTDATVSRFLCVSPGNTKKLFLTTGSSFHPGYCNPDMMFTCINNETGCIKTPVSCSH